MNHGPPRRISRTVSTTRFSLPPANSSQGRAGAIAAKKAPQTRSGASHARGPLGGVSAGAGCVSSVFWLIRAPFRGGPGAGWGVGGGLEGSGGKTRGGQSVMRTKWGEVTIDPQLGRWSGRPVGAAVWARGSVLAPPATVNGTGPAGAAPLRFTPTRS